MRGLLGPDGLIAAALSATSLLIAHRSRPHSGLPAGLAPLAYRYCRHCNQVTAHLIHSPTCRRCDTCNRLTYPGDDR
jgi:hypothetical protein